MVPVEVLPKIPPSSGNHKLNDGGKDKSTMKRSLPSVSVAPAVQPRGDISMASPARPAVVDVTPGVTSRKGLNPIPSAATAITIDGRKVSPTPSLESEILIDLPPVPHPPAKTGGD